MATICPTVTAYEPHGYRSQIELLEPFATRIHIDLMDGQFTPNISPTLDQIWWPDKITADLHLMFQKPMDQLDQLLKLKPNLVVFHYEADVVHQHMAVRLREAGIKAGLAILQQTSIESVEQILGGFDHVLVFSGNLGEHGGVADLALIDKVRVLRVAFPDIEISWDGGINDQNASQMIEAGVDVLNVGGFISNAADPEAAYQSLF